MPSAQLSNTLVSLKTPWSFAGEQYQGLRWKLEQLRQTRRLQVIAITSPDVNAGKTVTAINLAGTLARGDGARVLLVDGDLRCPSVGPSLGLDARRMGLGDAISDLRFGLKHVVRPLDEIAGVDVLLAGSRPAPIPELIRSPRLDALVQEARGHYDYILIDTPPLVPVCDAAVMSRVADGVLVVVAADGTPRKLLEQALSMVDESKVIGLVFNGDTQSLPSQYDAYYER